MTTTAWLLTGSCAWVLLAVPVAVLIARALPETTETDATDDLIATLPVDILGPLEINHEFFALVDPIEAEIDGRWTA